MRRGPTLKLLLDLAVSAALFWVVYDQFRNATGIVQLCDSVYSVAVAERMLTAGTADVSPVVPADPDVRRKIPWYAPDTDLPYQLVRAESSDGPAIYYGYPLGSSVLSVPFVRGFVERGLSTVRHDGTLNVGIEALIQQRVAAKVAAAVVVAFYVLARFFCPTWLAALVAAGLGFGSPVFSTLSRSLWSHTWQVLLLTLAVIALVAARRVRGRPFWQADLPIGLWLGTVAFWMMFVRPQSAISAAAIGMYLLGWHRRLIPGCVAAGVAWSAAYVAASYAAFGTATPPTVYSAGAVDGQEMLNRLFWLMASPSRGLIVYCPYLLVVGWALVAYRRQLADAPLLVPAGLAVAAYTVLFMAYNGWHAGNSFGPRYYADVFPWFALAAAMGTGAILRTLSVGFPWGKAAVASLAVVSVGWAVFVHYRGANAPETWEWNYLYNGQTQLAAKDWRYPQFLAGLTYRPQPGGIVEAP